MTPIADRSIGLAVCGAVLFVAGLCLWLGAPGLDGAAYRLIRLDAASALVPIARIPTRIGGAAALIPIGLLAVARLAATQRLRPAIWLFATIASGRIVVELLKIAVARPRPLLVDRLVLVDSASFPSSHSAGAMLTAIAIVIAFDRPRSWLAVAILFALLVGASRVLLGVHWPSDVLAGWGFGLLWAGGFTRIADRTR